MVGEHRAIGKHGREPVALTGIGCRFPGDANDAASYWKLLSTGVDAITEIPQDRWNIERYYHPEPGMPGKTYARWGGFIKGIDQFEPECFGISPREAAYMDPQQRLLLEVAWEAIEDGGQIVEQLKGTNTGVFVGISTLDYSIQQQASVLNIPTPHSATGGATSIAANRISYCLGLEGPSMAVDTACSSALVATHLACQSIWNHECDMALAGGVNIIISPSAFIAFCAASMLSPDGHCKAFDASANGFVRGEGAGIVVLKPLSKALANRDRIYGIVLASGVNQDGRTSGISAPSQSSQEALLRKVCQQAGIAPHEVQYLEAHGTGTALGDPIEATALGNVLSVGRPEGQDCWIGSVKTNIGHLEAAAGVAGLIKVALALKYRTIPPNLHFHHPNPAIAFGQLKLRVPCAPEPWAETGPAIAGVNAFGFGGTNACVVMMEYQQESEAHVTLPPDGAAPALLLPLSARTPEALQRLAQSYDDFLQGDSDHSAVALADLCYTASMRRTHFDHRLSLVAHNKEELVERLNAFIAGESRPGMYTGHRGPGDVPKLVFVFSGQGPQWWAMGRELLESEPIFRRTMETCDRILGQYADWSLLAELTADEASSRLQETAITQPALCALQIALAALWKSWGVEPHAVVGHSVGEIAAAHIAGALSLEEALWVIFHRGRCMDRASSMGKMLAVGCSWMEAKQAIRGYEDRVAVGASNSPSSVTLSGDPEALEQIAAALAEKELFCRFLQVNYAFHSPQMDPVREPLLEALEGLEPHLPRLPIISTVTGKPAQSQLFDPHYWWHNVRESVRFAEAIDWLIEHDYHLFAELSPHPVLSGAVSECLRYRGRQGTVLPSLRREEEERALLLGSLGALYTLGYPVDWQALCPDGARCVSLPCYPWQRQPYWHEPVDARESRLNRDPHPLLGRPLHSANPTWELMLDKRLLNYLDDHNVQGNVLIPAAAYVEMGCAAAREHLGVDTCVLEEMQFQRTLLVPDGDDLPIMQLICYPADTSFAIYSRPSQADQNWTLHAIGYLRPLQELQAPAPVDLAALRTRLPEVVPAEHWYNKFEEVGLFYGPTFQGIERIWRIDCEALGQLRLPEPLVRESARYRFHPALLDACFQTIIGAIPTAVYDRATGKSLYLPVQIDRVYLYRHPGHHVWSHVRLTKISDKVLEADICLYDDDGHLLMQIDTFRCQGVQGMRDNDATDVTRWLYEVKWRNKPRSEQSLVRRTVDYIPASREIEQPVRRAALQLIEERGWWQRYAADIIGHFDTLCTAYLVRAFHHLGWPYQVGDRIAIDTLIEQLRIVPQYHRLTRRLLLLLEHMGYLTKRDTETWVVDQNLPELDPQPIWQRLLWDYPAAFADLSLINSCGSHLAEVLQGEVEPLHLLFPEGSTTTAEHLYQDSPAFRLYNTMMQKAMSTALRHLPRERAIRVLEIGAGTGGLTPYVLPTLPANRTDYVFTDVSPLFLAKAEQKFHNYDFVRFGLLDIEKDPLEQEYVPHSFDIILASDVLHATSDIRETLGNIQKLLASEGMLLFLEVEAAYFWVDMVFGLTDGWWRFRDVDLRPEHPLLSRHAWQAVLEEVGFHDVISVSPNLDDEHSAQVLLLARGPHIEDEPQTLEADTALHRPVGEPGSWLIFADQNGVAQQLAHQLRSYGEACVLVTPGNRFECLDREHFEIDPQNPAEMAKLLQAMAASHPTWRGTVHLWSLDTPPPVETSLRSLQHTEVLGCHCVLHYVQALYGMESLPTPLPHLTLVTQGAQPINEGTQPVSVSQAPLIGLGRVIKAEHPDMHCKMVDLAPDPASHEIQSLVAELCTADPDEEVTLRHGARFVPRLERARPEEIVAERSTPGAGGSTPFRLGPPPSGIIDHLALRQTTRQAPRPGQVEIEVYSVSLNFRDVMKVLGLYPSDGDDYMLLGDECAGRIVAIGAGVDDFKVGDDVVAIAPGSFGSYVTTSAALVMHKPALITFEEAVTIPVAFLTAYYGLHHLARMRPGERVLIHSAAGGVGLAAVQIAQHAGAEVFATAGTEEKRDLLRFLGVKHVMDSRSLAFADQIAEATAGRGVDIVLNSLAGKAIAKGISCLAPYGRFLELGKRDIYQNSKLGLWGFRKNASLFAIDLGGLMTEQPAVMRSLLEALSRCTEEGSFHPLPHRVFPASRIVDAFRYMAQARHIGKIVISMQQDDVSVEPLEATVAFRPDATYLITGGFGGLGLTLANWIIEHGGRHIVLMGRSGASSEEAQQALEALQRTGAQVMAAQADVSHEQQVAEVLADMDRTMPPLRGIFHAAMVLEDSMILQANREQFRKVMTPKVDGAWNLHAQTLDRPLDFFVLFSSVSSLVGNPGQGNYVAANAFFDTFAYYRRSLDLPAITINWGQITEVGYVSRHQGVADLLSRRGLLGFSPKQAMAALGRMLQRQPIQMGVMRIDWQKLAASTPADALPQRLSSLVSASALNQQGREEGSRIREALQQASPQEREEVVKTYIREQVARVLGASADALDADRTLNELGLDSLMGVELKNRVESDLSITIPTLELMSSPTINSLTTVLLNQLGMPSAPSSVAPDARQDRADEAPTELDSEDEVSAMVDQLSDEEVEALIQEMAGEEVDKTPQIDEESKG